MRIGIVVSYTMQTLIGGTQRQAWHLARELAKRHEVIIFTRRVRGLTHNKASHHGVKIVYTTSLPTFFGPVRYVTHVGVSVSEIRKRRNQLDVLICFTTTPSGVIGSLVKRLAGLPFCTLIRGKDWYRIQSNVFGRCLLHWVFKQSNRVVVQTARIAEQVKQTFPGTFPMVLPNGIDLDNRVARGDSLLFVGSLMKNKGVHLLLKAVEGLSDVPVVIAGEGKEKKKLEKMARGRNVVFLGSVHPDKIKDLMIERGRILTLPSVGWEALPNVLMEAMSVGLPVIAADFAGTRDLLEDGKRGVLVPPGDDKELRRAIVKLWFDDDLRAQFMRAGKGAIAAYSWDRVLPMYEAMVASIVNQNC
jgi:glycosyltransferase involved in cell wall biosynthesis